MRENKLRSTRKVQKSKADEIDISYIDINQSLTIRNSNKSPLEKLQKGAAPSIIKSLKREIDLKDRCCPEFSPLGQKEEQE